MKCDEMVIKMALKVVTGIPSMYLVGGGKVLSYVNLEYRWSCIALRSCNH